MSEHYLSEAEERWLDKEEQNLIRRRNNEKQTMIGPTDSKAINQFLESALTTPPVKSDEFTKVDVRQFGVLIITDNLGAVRGTVLGELGPGAALTKCLRDAYDAECPNVRKMEDSLTPLGQDTYEVDRDFLLGALSNVWDWEEIDTLKKVLPLECRCTFVINY